jgi:hypothetical protein
VGRETYLVCYYGTAGGTCVCRNDDAAVEETSDNGGSCAGGVWQRHALGVQGGVAVVVREIEARHVGMRMDFVVKEWGRLWRGSLMLYMSLVSAYLRRRGSSCGISYCGTGHTVVRQGMSEPCAR